MSMLATIKSTAKHLDRDVRYGRGGILDQVAGQALETTEYAGTAYLAAYYNASRGEAAKWRGVEKTYSLGIVGKLVSVLASLVGYDGWWTPHLDTVSTAAIGTHFAFLGAKKGAEVAKVSRPPGITGMENIGALPAAPTPGDCLDRREINELGRMHAY